MGWFSVILKGDKLMKHLVPLITLVLAAVLFCLPLSSFAEVPGSSEVNQGDFVEEWRIESVQYQGLEKAQSYSPQEEPSLETYAVAEDTLAYTYVTYLKTVSFPNDLKVSVEQLSQYMGMEMPAAPVVADMSTKTRPMVRGEFYRHMTELFHHVYAVEQVLVRREVYESPAPAEATPNPSPSGAEAEQVIDRHTSILRISAPPTVIVHYYQFDHPEDAEKAKTDETYHAPYHYVDSEYFVYQSGKYVKLMPSEEELLPPSTFTTNAADGSLPNGTAPAAP